MYSVPDNAPKEDKAIIQLVNQGMDPERLFKASATVNSATIAQQLIAAGRDKVEGGVYKGMKLHPSYIGSMLLPKITGTYELEVQYLIEKNALTYDSFIDVGCAEGFHLIGAAKLMRKPCMGIDINPSCHEAIQTIAAENGVDEIVSFESNLSNAFLMAHGNIFILVDVDGSEMSVLQDIQAHLKSHSADIHSCQLIIESDRNLDGSDNTHLIVDYLCRNHWSIQEIQKQIPAYRFSPLLSHLSLLDQVAFGSEGRPGKQCWIRAIRSI